MGMNMYDLYLILNVFHSKGVALWAGDVYDYVMLFHFNIVYPYYHENYLGKPVLSRQK